jgi:hypothetical protein
MTTAKHDPKSQNPVANRAKAEVLSWRDLEVWSSSHNTVLRIYHLTKLFPADERFRLTDQLCRAAASVPADIAEGKGRSSLKEYVQFLSIARGSTEEVKYFCCSQGISRT